MTIENDAASRNRYAEHKKQIDEKGYDERNGERFYEVETPYGKIWFITTLEDQKKIFRNMIILHSFVSEGYEIKEGTYGNLIFDPSGEETLSKILQRHFDADAGEYVAKATERAINYFADKLPEMFAAAMKGFVEETLLYAVVKAVGETVGKPPQTELSVFKGFSKFDTARTQSRLGIRKSSGRETVLTDERLREMLRFYDSALPLLRAAKKAYRSFQRKRGRESLKEKRRRRSLKEKRGWVSVIGESYPQIPTNIIEKLDLGDISPSGLALKWTAKKFKVRSSEYLRKAIIRIRRDTVKNG